MTQPPRVFKIYSDFAIVLAPRESATEPERANSRIPKVSITSRNALSLAELPVASMITESTATSITRARNRFAASTTWGRVRLSALTFTKSSWRPTDVASSSSSTLCTWMSLYSCLVICSTEWGVASTTTVRRLMPSFAVFAETRETRL